MHRRWCRPVAWLRWKGVPPHPGYRSAASSVHCTTICKHSLVLLRMGEIIARGKHVELIGIINKPLLLHLFGCLYYCISDARSYKQQIQNIYLAFFSGVSSGVLVWLSRENSVPVKKIHAEQEKYQTTLLKLLTTSEFIIKRLIFSLQKFVQMTFREN